MKVIACIEDQDIIDRILAHLREKEQEAPARPLLVPPTRAPPATLSLFAGSEFQPHISKDATEKTMAWTTAGSRSGMDGSEWHATHSEPGFRINQRELLQISNHGQQNQRGCLLSTGPLYYLYLNSNLLGAIRASAGNFQLLVAKVKANIRGNTLDGLEGLRRHINLLNSCAVITY